MSKFAYFNGQRPRHAKIAKKPVWSAEQIAWSPEVNFLGLNQAGLGWVGGGKSPKSEAVRDFFSQFLHVFANFSETTGPISKMLMSLYSSLQALHNKQQN